MRKKTFCNIAIKEETKRELELLKAQLNEQYLNDATYDDLMRALLQKNKKVILSREELKRILAESRGVKWG